MGRLPDESSVIYINSGTDLGDYAFHEINDLKDWFVEEAPDGSSNWEALPPSHPLSRRRRQTIAMTALSAIPVLKKPLTAQPVFQWGLVATVGAGLAGLLTLGLQPTAKQVVEPPAAQVAAAAPVAIAPAPTVEAAPPLLAIEPKEPALEAQAVEPPAPETPAAQEKVEAEKPVVAEKAPTEEKPAARPSLKRFIAKKIDSIRNHKRKLEAKRRKKIAKRHTARPPRKDDGRVIQLYD